MRVVIVGVGEIGQQLAESLARRKGNELVLVDIDENRCDQLAGNLDALVIQGEGSDPAILKKAQITEADALVATTGSDAINTVIAMLGHRFQVQKIIVKLGGAGLRSALQEIGVSKIIAPKFSAASEIISTLYGFDLVNFSVVASGGLQLAQLEVGKAAKKRAKELDFPDGAHLTAVLREERMLLPRGDLKLEEGDELILIFESEDVLEKVKDQLQNQTEKEK